MKIQRTYPQIFTALIVGVFIGSVSFGNASAEETAASTPPIQVLNVCIDKKTYAMRAVKFCKSTERAVILGVKGPQGMPGATGAQGNQGATGAVGATGNQGSTGATGAQGNQGITGATGAPGSVASLRTRSITVWEQGFSSFCGSFGGFYALNGNTSLSQFGSTISLNKSCSSLVQGSVTVYAP